MTPHALSALIIRFVAIGLLVYGIILLSRGLMAQSEIAQVQATFHSLTGLSGTGGNIAPTSNFGDSMNKVVRTLFIAAGGSFLASVLLYWSSRRLGALIAKGL